MKNDFVKPSLTLLAVLAALSTTTALSAGQEKDSKVVKAVGDRFPTSTYARKHLFPGVGDYKLWEQADKLYVEAGKLDDQGRARPAADKYAEAISIYPHDMNFFNNYGLMLLKLHDELGAEAAWRYAIAGKTHFWEAQNNLGRLLFFQKRLAEAKYVWSKALENEPPSQVRQDITANVLLCNQRIEKLRAVSSPKPQSNDQQQNNQQQNGGQSYTTGTAPDGAMQAYTTGTAPGSGTQSNTTGTDPGNGTNAYTTGTNYPYGQSYYSHGVTTHPDGTQTFTTGTAPDTLPPAPTNAPQ